MKIQKRIELLSRLQPTLSYENLRFLGEGVGGLRVGSEFICLPKQLFQPESVGLLFPSSWMTGRGVGSFSSFFSSGCIDPFI